MCFAWSTEYHAILKSVNGASSMKMLLNHKIMTRYRTVNRAIILKTNFWHPKSVRFDRLFSLIPTLSFFYLYFITLKHLHVRLLWSILELHFVRQKASNMTQSILSNFAGFRVYHFRRVKGWYLEYLFSRHVQFQLCNIQFFILIDLLIYLFFHVV